MTLGQRIAQKRKELGLSQEALGEALGVSRQAISKWESDSAIPEIDKLVALARLFDLSVGVLLGVEEDACGAALTDRELQAVDAVVERYLARLDAARSAGPEPPPGRTHSAHPLAEWLLIPLIALGIIFAAASIGRLWRTAAQLRQQVDQLQSDMSSLRIDVSGQISSIAGRVETALTQQESLVAGYSWACTGSNPQAGTVTLRVEAVPKTYVDGMSATFVLRSGGETLSSANARYDSKARAFLANVWVVPARDDAQLWVTFEAPGGQAQTQALETLYNLAYHTGVRLGVARRADRDELELSLEVGSLSVVYPTALTAHCGDRTVEVDLESPWRAGEGSAAVPSQAPVRPGVDAPLARWQGQSVTYYAAFDGPLPDGDAWAQLTLSSGQTLTAREGEP